MTIQEAKAVNVLLTHILGKHRSYPIEADVRQAAEILAGKAYKALYAGWSPKTVAEAWAAKKKVKVRRDD